MESSRKLREVWRAGHGEAMSSGLLRSTAAQLRSNRDDHMFGGDWLGIITSDSIGSFFGADRELILDRVAQLA